MRSGGINRSFLNCYNSRPEQHLTPISDLLLTSRLEMAAAFSGGSEQEITDDIGMLIASLNRLK